jgi:hypothetical protein
VVVLDSEVVLGEAGEVARGLQVGGEVAGEDGGLGFLED